MEWFVDWGERQICRGEGGKEQADVNGQLTTRVQRDVWALAMTKGHVLIWAPEIVERSCVDVCHFCCHWEAIQRHVVWTTTWGHLGVQGSCCHGDHANLGILYSHLWPW